MEKNRFLWLMKVLAKERVPLLDCYVIGLDKVESLYSMSSAKEFSAQGDSSEISELLSKIFREYFLLSRLQDIPETVCYFFKD